MFVESAHHFTCFIHTPGRLLPKFHALQRLQRHIDRMRCLNTTLFALFSERRCGRVKANYNMPSVHLVTSTPPCYKIMNTEPNLECAEYC